MTPSRAEITLYARPDCHLCDEARSGLERLRAEGLEFEFREIDIDTEEKLLRTHLERIPVIEVNGTEVCELGLDANAIRSRLGTVSA